MAWEPISEAELMPGKAILAPFRKVWACLQYLYGLLGTVASAGVQNGSMEVDSVGAGQPDHWTKATYPGGSGQIVTEVAAHGSNAVRLVHPGGAGNGGGYYESDYVVCSGLVKVFHGFVHWGTAGMHNQVVVRYFDKDKVYLSQAAVYDSADNPTVPTYFIFGVQPPANARYYKVRLVGGVTDTDVAGNAYFDGVCSAGMEIFSVRTAEATIGETFHDGEAWADVASMTFLAPHLGLPMRISFDAEGARQAVGVESAMRFRSGASYSNELLPEAVWPDYSTAAFALYISAVPADGHVTVHLQLRGSTGVYGRKSVAGVSMLTSIAQ